MGSFRKIRDQWSLSKINTKIMQKGHLKNLFVISGCGLQSGVKWWLRGWKEKWIFIIGDRFSRYPSCLPDELTPIKKSEMSNNLIGYWLYYVILHTYSLLLRYTKEITNGLYRWEEVKHFIYTGMSLYISKWFLSCPWYNKIASIPIEKIMYINWYQI